MHIGTLCLEGLQAEAKKHRWYGLEMQSHAASEEQVVTPLMVADFAEARNVIYLLVSLGSCSIARHPPFTWAVL